MTVGEGLSVGEALIKHLEARGVEVVFGIPGVHTVELYRGLATSSIRHVTSRHEQGAGFMADGYARVSGKPGVALVITGPGVTNILTPMAQARADSVPMLVLSGVNETASLGRELGHLHELPDQQGMVARLTSSIRVTSPDDLAVAFDRVFADFSQSRPGPAHIEIPLDTAKQRHPEVALSARPTFQPTRSHDAIPEAVGRIRTSKASVIVAGGGARGNDAKLTELAEKLDAPTILTTNARGLMHHHPLTVPASPTLQAVRDLIEGADLVIAIGTEIGQTDFDTYGTGVMPSMEPMIRIDVSSDQLSRRPADVTICADAGTALDLLLAELGGGSNARSDGALKAADVRDRAYQEIGPQYRGFCDILDAIRDAAPNSIIAGDSTQLIYAGNFYYDHDRPSGWFNAATGYGALGFGIPAAIGAALASPGERVLCITGDGGAQFSIAELMAAVDEKLPVTVLVWNNRGYEEIDLSMRNAGVDVVGCDPTPPDFGLLAAACGLPFIRCQPTPGAVADAVREASTQTGPVMIEVDAT